jgi:hypothetical protein
LIALRYALPAVTEFFGCGGLLFGRHRCLVGGVSRFGGHRSRTPEPAGTGLRVGTAARPRGLRLLARSRLRATPRLPARWSQTSGASSKSVPQLGTRTRCSLGARPGRDVSWGRAAGPRACDAVGAGARRRGRSRVAPRQPGRATVLTWDPVPVGSRRVSAKPPEPSARASGAMDSTSPAARRS